ncbi:MAG: KpsF/GutQ family sugar-phosphate isomerase [Candidatus Omnitrophica bacterium]|nr:KpsF/GutQ family sugar-phosphate isomerase [Candidatus Omnitrophota bacterium]MBI2174633.1 KpsF/GutQ family sugar-phosphate isomerase [Candidatus Omnitrophota bacterium]MBI3009709.1 KpsF/GutQ family sugar-phosphate isomerase [Candidatus Omnitrophota bacterium]
MRRRNGIVRAREVLRIEAQAIQRLLRRVDHSFIQAVELLAACKGRVVVTGMGKAGLIGQKISATLASTGTPSHSVHPAEAIHGDLGRVTKEDVMIVLSKSGETEELTRLLPVIKRLGSKLIALTGNPHSTLAKHSDVVLDVSVTREACSLNLAPTASTTAMLAFGDALAVVVAEQKGFREKDFALLHPGGQLGRKLLLRVTDLMRTADANPIVRQTARVKDVLLATTRARAGCASIIDEQGRLVGIFTDGDLRRHLDSAPNLAELVVKNVMTTHPKTIAPDCLAAEALRLLREHKIDELVVVNAKKQPVGLLDVQDLLRAGL